MDALVGFGGGSLSRRASFARQKSTDKTSNKDKKSKENESDSEEDEGKKLLNQIDGLIGNLGIVDPMTGNNKRNMSKDFCAILKTSDLDLYLYLSFLDIRH